MLLIFEQGWMNSDVKLSPLHTGGLDMQDLDAVSI